MVHSAAESSAGPSASGVSSLGTAMSMASFLALQIVPAAETSNSTSDQTTGPSTRDKSSPVKTVTMSLLVLSGQPLALPVMPPPVPSGQPLALPVAPSPVQSLQTAVDERNIPGMDRVDCLAEYLVGLHSVTSLTLTNQQARTIVGLLQNMSQFDKDQVVYAARHQNRLLMLRPQPLKKGNNLSQRNNSDRSRLKPVV